MKLATFAILIVLTTGCGSSPPAAAGAAGSSSAGSGGSGVSGAGPWTGSGGLSSGGGGSSSVGAAGKSGAAGASSGSFGGARSMHLISRDVPAFDASNQVPNPYEGPNLANDDSGVTGWASHTIPTWLAYDLSGVPAVDRHQVLIFWNANNNVYLSDPQPWEKMPIDYAIETNSAPGAATPPSDGWTELYSTTDNKRGSVVLELDLAGANWVRVRVTKSSDPTALQMDMDVFSTTGGASDSWLFMGDSITYMALMRGFSNLPGMVDTASPGRWPIVIDAAIGGTGAITAVNVIDDTLWGYPGQFVVLAYGTNDHPDGFGANMETLVKAVIAAGKVPVVPHVIWADSKLTEGPLENAAIDDLYAKYSEILKGPDLWAVFENRTDLIPPGDVHPNAAGQDVLREQWKNLILQIP